MFHPPVVVTFALPLTRNKQRIKKNQPEQYPIEKKKLPLPRSPLAAFDEKARLYAVCLPAPLFPAL